MDRILRAAPGWQEAIAAALASVPRPIATDARLMPRVVGDLADADRERPSDAGSGLRLTAARRAATLLLLYPNRGGELAIPLTVRQPHLRAHAGEVSLPGGAVEPSDATPREAALREAREEIGLSPENVLVVGSLDEMWIPVSNFRIRPYVAVATRPPALVPHAPEVAALVELPARVLLADEAIADQLIEGRGSALRAGAYLHADQVIWGATARALAMMATVLRHAEAIG